MLKLVGSKLLLLAVFSSAFSLSASAQELFNWSYSSANGDAARGTLTADLVSGSLSGEGQFEVVSLTGTWDESQAVGPTGSNGANNEFTYNGSTGAFQISQNGIGFTSGNNQISFTGPADAVDGSPVEVLNGSASDLTASSLRGNEAPWEPSDLIALSSFAALAFGNIWRKRKTCSPNS